MAEGLDPKLDQNLKASESESLEQSAAAAKNENTLANRVDRDEAALIGAASSRSAPFASQNTEGQDFPIQEVEAFLDKIAAASSELSAHSDEITGEIKAAPESLTRRPRASASGKGTVSDITNQAWQHMLPDNTPPCSDFVPKLGVKSLEDQERDHAARKAEKLAALDSKQQLPIGVDGANFDDSDDPDDADEEFATKDTDAAPVLDTPLLRAQIDCQTLTELIFGEEDGTAGSGEDNGTAGSGQEYTPEQLSSLLEQLLPPGDTQENPDGYAVPVPREGDPVLFEMGPSPGPDKVHQAILGTLGLYDEEGTKRKGLFNET